MITVPHHHDRGALGALVAVAALVTALVAGGCSGGDKAGAMKRARPPASVTVDVARKASVPLEVSTVGSVVPFATVSVQPRVSGQITSLKFKEGQTVDKGALLFEIDREPYVAALAQAEAVLARDQAQLDNADAEASRYAQMITQKLVSPQEADSKAATAKALHATVVADQAAVDKARLDLSWTRVTSPITGRTDKREITVGNLVQPGGAPVVVIRQVSPIQVSFGLPQERLYDVQQRMKSGALEVQARLPEHEDVVAKGTLTFVGGAVDASTGSVPCKADFDNKDELLWPGAYVRVVLRLGVRDDAVVVPASAVQTSQQGPFVFVVKADDTVEMRPVKTGPAHDGTVVVDNGVGAGEKIVVDGQLALVPGAHIVEKPAVTGEPSAAPSGAGGAPAQQGDGKRTPGAAAP